MVRAILDGTKTQTRRVVKPSRGRPIEFLGGGGSDGPDWNNPECWGYEWQDGASFVTLKADPMEMHQYTYPCPYGQPGDRLWVRETFCDDWQDTRGIVYRADGGLDGEMADAGCKWRPSIHMPRAASRITLEVTGVRVERLQDISIPDAMAEGVVETNTNLRGLEPCMEWCYAFEDLWQSINGPGSWDANPWVWVIEFKKVG